MKNHNFHSKDRNGIYLIECLKTAGRFSTALWRKGKVKNQVCPCCGEAIR